MDFPSKYYPADVGLRNARLNFRQVEPDHLMECAIYNELIARSASVDVGLVEVEARAEGKREKKQLEIDFVVNTGRGKAYIQSAYRLAPWRKQMNRILTILMITFALAAVTLVYLSISERMKKRRILAGIPHWLPSPCRKA